MGDGRWGVGDGEWAVKGMWNGANGHSVRITMHRVLVPSRDISVVIGAQDTASEVPIYVLVVR